jgi:hypothetical protein
VVRSEESRAQALKGGADMSGVVKMSLEFEVEDFHECESSHGQKRE